MDAVQRVMTRACAAFVAALVLAVISVNAAFAQTEKRVALVIGNGAYKNATRLPNPANDAQDVATALKRVGFETILGLDLDRAAMDDHAVRFARAAREADVAIFYYSGHAMQFAGVNYLMPIDAKLTDEADLRRMARVDDIVSDLQQAKNLRILVLDSCRDNPLAEELKRSIGRTRAAGVQRGLAKIDSPQGMIVAYATQSGRTADDGAGRNSPYTAAFLKHIEAQDEIGTVFRRVSADVFEATKRAQLPELSLSLIGDFYLHGRPTAMPPVAALPAAPERDAPATVPAPQRATTEAAVVPSMPGNTAPARSLFTEQDAQRVIAIGRKHSLVLPEYKIERPANNIPAAIRRFVGVWASEIGFNGGAGRQVMIIVMSVDASGRALGYYVNGPPTPRSFEQDAASFVQFAGQINKDKLVFKLRRFTGTLTLTAGDRLFFVVKRLDGRQPTVTVEPVWRLVEAEQSAAKNR